MKFTRMLQQLFGSKKRMPVFPKKGMQTDKTAMMQKMLTMLSNTQDVELTCDEVYAVLDQFAELAAQGEDVAQLMPLIQQHLDMCEDCRDEYKVLVNILQNAA